MAAAMALSPPANDPPSTQRRPFNAEGHVKVVGGLQVVLAIFFLIGGAAVIFGGAFSASTIREEGNEPELASMVENVVRVVGFVLLVLSAVGIAGAIGLFLHAPWGRALSFVFAAVSLLNLPFGTAVGIYALVVLSKRETADLFRAAPPRGMPA